MRNEVQWEYYDTQLSAAIPEAFWVDPLEYSAAHADTLKRGGHHRETGIFPVQGGGVLVKHCVLSTVRERVERWCGRSALQREWRVLCHLARIGDIAPRPIACGWQRRGKEWHGWLLAEFMVDTVTFDTLSPPRDSCRAYPAARALGRAVALLHAAGVTHGDLHSGNLLYNPRTCSWHVTDFSQARIGRTRRSDLVQDLVQLQHCLGKKVPLKVRIAFLTEYLDAFGEATGTSEELTGREWRWLWAEIWRRSVRYSIEQAGERNERCVRATRELAPLSEWVEPTLARRVWSGWTVRTLSRCLVQDLVSDVLSETWYLQGHVTVLRHTRERVIGVWTHPHGRVMITEQREPTRWFLRWLKRVREGDPLRLWRASWRLHALHIGTPAPLLIVRMPGRIVLVQEYSDMHIALQALMRDVKMPPGFPTRRRVIRAVAEAVALLHDRGVAHGALLPANIHVGPASGGATTVLFTGISRMRFYRRLPWRRRVRDLTSLYTAAYGFTTGAERRAFLRRYCASLSQPCDPRQLILSVWEASHQ
ncbi:MAG: hypothetical protein N2595_10500 [bacterium]|nr:hypothetical protein [bacterium]